MVEFSLDRGSLAEGTVSRPLAITTDGQGGGAIEVRARVERAPVVRIDGGPRRLSCPWSAPPFVEASVIDESALSAVVLDWSGPGSSGSTPMAQRSGGWHARLDLEAINGSWSYRLAATDVRGNVGVAEGSIVVQGC